MGTKALVGPEDLLIETLLDFYSDPVRMSIFVSIVEQGTVISLRLLDWFSTNYSKFNKIYINKVDIHTDYKNKLNGYRKNLFDPFCRKQRIWVYCKSSGSDGLCLRNAGSMGGNERYDLGYRYIDSPEEYYNRKEGIVTTIGQLNFFKWCMEKNVIGYIMNNISNIEKAMTDNTINKKERKKRKLCSTVHKTMMNIVIKFN